MKSDNNRPVVSFKHEDKRAAIPDSARQGEEQMAISGQPEIISIMFIRCREHLNVRHIENEIRTSECSITGLISLRNHWK